ncbi:MAG: TonB-dependent receptor plug domain-containing protein [Parahaliea sp.]
MSATAQNMQLEEVVVTAQKREEALEDVPISITAVTGQQLENAGITNVRDLPKIVPGLRIDQQGPFTQPTIRGVGSSTAGAGMTSNVATYIDGFYVPSQLGTSMEFLNIQSIQVLKGPQGTLFGRNATGGAILLQTTNPSYEPCMDSSSFASTLSDCVKVRLPTCIRSH